MPTPTVNKSSPAPEPTQRPGVARDELYNLDTAINPNGPKAPSKEFDVALAADTLRAKLIQFAYGSGDEESRQEARRSLLTIASKAIEVGKERELGVEFDRQYMKIASYFARNDKDLPLEPPRITMYQALSKDSIKEVVSGLFFDPARWKALVNEAQVRDRQMSEELKTIRQRAHKLIAERFATPS